MGQLTDYAKEKFKNLLSRYTEDNYFYIARNYLGLIPTPFHKPAITTRLCSFFSQQTIQERIISLLDEMDCTILSLVSVSSSIDAQTCTALLKGKWSYGTLLRRVSNLQERMVLLNDEGKLVFNPLLEERLKNLCSLKPLFGTEQNRQKSTPYCSTEFVRAYISLIEKEKKVVFKDEYALFFPAYNLEQLQLIFTSLTDTLNKLCIIYQQKDRKTSINYTKVHQLLSLNDRQLLCFLVAFDLDERAIKEGVQFTNNLIAILEKIGCCDTSSLKLLLRTLALKAGIRYDSSLIDCLSKWGLITLDELWYANQIEENVGRTTLVVDSDNTISYSGSCCKDDILYRFAEISVLDRQTSYKVTPQSFTRGLDNLLVWEQVKTYLEHNSYPSMSISLIKLLQITYERYHQITIYDGIVLTCDDRTSRLIENLESIQEHHLQTIAANVYLMRRSTEMLWRQILTSSGVLLPSTIADEQVEVIHQEDNFIFTLLLKESTIEPLVVDIMEFSDEKHMDEDPSIANAIEKATLTSSQRQDLEHRYNARMILIEEQIVPQVVNGVIEAGGFDYQGKVGLCRQAVGKQNIALQLQLTDQELVVQALEVAYTPQKEALLKAAVMPTMEVKIIPVSKIFLVRQLRYHLC